MNEEFAIVQAVAAKTYKPPIARHQFAPASATIPSNALAGILPLPWIALIMQLAEGRVGVLFQQHYMLQHAETCRAKVAAALLSYGNDIEFMDCESEAALVEELYAQTRPVVRRKSA